MSNPSNHSGRLVGCKGGTSATAGMSPEVPVAEHDGTKFYARAYKGQKALILWFPLHRRWQHTEAVSDLAEALKRVENAKHGIALPADVLPAGEKPRKQFAYRAEIDGEAYTVEAVLHDEKKGKGVAYWRAVWRGIEVATGTRKEEAWHKGMGAIRAALREKEVANG